MPIKIKTNSHNLDLHHRTTNHRPDQWWFGDLVMKYSRQLWAYKVHGVTIKEQSRVWHITGSLEPNSLHAYYTHTCDSDLVGH